MPFPPNYRQNRQDRIRAKDRRSREKEARREERRQRKPDNSVESLPAGERQATADKE